MDSNRLRQLAGMKPLKEGAYLKPAPRIMRIHEQTLNDMKTFVNLLEEVTDEDTIDRNRLHSILNQLREHIREEQVSARKIKEELNIRY